MSLLGLLTPRFLRIRLGNESCDQISASSNGPKRARESRDKSRESRDKNAPPPRKTAGSLFTRVHILIEFSQSKIVSSRFITKHTKTIHQDHYRLRNTIQILLKTRSFFYSSCSFCLFCALAIDKCN